MSANETEEFAILWTKAQPAVSAFVSALVPNFHEAEDVLDQVVVTLVRKFSTYDRERPFVNWAIGVARFEVLKHRRSRANERHYFCDELVAEICSTYQEMSLELEEQKQFLRECLEEVRGRSRKALQLRYFDDLKPAAIGEALGMNSGAVRVMLHRVRASIRQCLEKKLGPLASE